MSVIRRYWFVLRVLNNFIELRKFGQLFNLCWNNLSSFKLISGQKRAYSLSNMPMVSRGRNNNHGAQPVQWWEPRGRVLVYNGSRISQDLH